MKTPREVILERHQSAEAKLKDIRAENLAACARSAVEPSVQRRPSFDLSAAAARFCQEALWPWRQVWIGVAASWLVILAVSLATGEMPAFVAAKPARLTPEVLAALRQQQQLLTQLLGTETPPPVARPRLPGPRSEAEPPPGTEAETRRLRIRLWAETFAAVQDMTSTTARL
jgi:hypothetical protein